MFDIDAIEKDWLDNSFSLSEEQILDIFMSDNATIPQYEEALGDWEKKTHVKIPELTPEERLLRVIYGEDFENEELKRQRNRMMRLLEIKLAKYPEPKKQHLSKENQRIVVEGSMGKVFEHVRYYDYMFQGKISKETLYYLFLETLMSVAKYMIHCGKPVFYMYVNRSFNKAMIKYISVVLKVSYDEAKDIEDYYKNIAAGVDPIWLDKEEMKKYDKLSKECLEDPTSPFDLRYILRNQQSNDDTLINIKEEEFLNKYNAILNTLSEEEKMVMKLSYDINGYRGLTYKEIADFLGYEETKVSNIKRRALKHIRKLLK